MKIQMSAWPVFLLVFPYSLYGSLFDSNGFCLVLVRCFYSVSTGNRAPCPGMVFCNTRTVRFRWLCRCIAPPTFENIDNELSVDSIAWSSQVVPPRQSVQNRNNTVPVLRYFSPGFQIKVLVCITSSGAGKIPIHSISMCNWWLWGSVFRGVRTRTKCTYTVYVHPVHTPCMYMVYVRGVRTPMNYVITMPISDWLAVFNGEYR
jgi:hypothetical protein